MTAALMRLLPFDALRALIAGGCWNAAGIGFSLYIAVIVYSGLSSTPELLMDIRTGDISMSSAGEGSLKLAIPLLVLGLLIFSRHGIRRTLMENGYFLACLAIFSSATVLSTGLSSPASSSVAQIAQFVLTIIVFLLCMAFWKSPLKDVNAALSMTVLTLCGMLVAAAAVQGFHDYRWVGSIHPNHFARYAFVALVLHSVLVQRASLIVCLICVAACYAVSARTVMIGTAVFYIGFHILGTLRLPKSKSDMSHLSIRAAWTALIASVLVGSIFLFVDSEKVAERLADDFAVFDPDRGIFSGFTGRADSWTGFFNVMPELVFSGYGFRSGRYDLHSVHSGVLSYFLDFGMIAGGILLLGVTGRGLFLVFHGRKLRDGRTLLCGLAIISTLIIQCFEPDNFNIGFIGSFFFMLLLAYTPLSKELNTTLDVDCPHLSNSKIESS